MLLPPNLIKSSNIFCYIQKNKYLSLLWTCRMKFIFIGGIWFIILIFLYLNLPTINLIAFPLTWLIWFNNAMELSWDWLLKRKCHLHKIFKSIFIFIVWYFGNNRETRSMGSYFQVLRSINIGGISQYLHIGVWHINLSLGNYTFILYFPLLYIILLDIRIITILCRLYILIRFLIVFFLTILLSFIQYLFITRFTPIPNKPLIKFRLLSFCDFVDISIIRSL